MARAGQWRKPSVFAALAALPLLVGTTGVGSDLDRRVLAAQNRERAMVGVPPLAWDAQLAADARRWADHLAASNRFYHAPDEPGADPQGENLWSGTSGYYSPEAMVGLWAGEKRDFRPGTFPANSRTGDVEDVGHYTQLVWRRTRSVGCAVARGHGDDVLVCRYATAGNVLGETPF